MAALEVNPLLVNGPEVEALDALITWSWGHHRRRGPSKGRGGWWVVVEETRGMGAGPE